MKIVSKILGIVIAFFVLLPATILAENIDECKSDLYFANGIMMKYSEKNALKMWKKEVKKLLASRPEIFTRIANRKMSYNASEGFLDDLLESFEQVMNNEWGWQDFSVYFANYLKIHGVQELAFQHNIDLDRQITAYKNSIKLGHNVIVIAHSQGNYYTNEAYEYLADWMKPYFHMMGVATPANHVAGDGPYVKFHNDFIKSVVTGLPSNRIDPNNSHNQTFSIAAHDFYESYLTAENTRTDIKKFILDKIEGHEKAPSQWETDQEFELNTCNYKITVKHRYDPSIEMAEKVYPFNGSKKLYQADGEWVKASCGGTHILDQWDGKKENECWMIDNVEEEKIVGEKQNCAIKVSYVTLEQSWINGSYTFDKELYKNSDSYGIEFGNSDTYKFTIEYDSKVETYIAYTGEKGWENSCGNRIVITKGSSRYGATDQTFTTLDGGYSLRLPDEW